MTYQIVYSSEATIPMQEEDLEELLVQARTNNAALGITGALVYAEGMFLQILEGERARVMAVMAKIEKDLRHETVTVLRESDIAAPVFGAWKMAYVSATPEQVAKWAGLSGAKEVTEIPNDADQDLRRTAQFAQDILSLLAPEDPSYVKQL